MTTSCTSSIGPDFIFSFYDEFKLKGRVWLKIDPTSKVLLDFNPKPEMNNQWKVLLPQDK